MRKLLLTMTIMVLSCVSLLAQKTTVTGKVTDPNGASIAGASVREKGTKNGTSADANGKYSISVGSGATLIISAAGFATVEVAAANASTVSLKVSAVSLEEVVVTGVGSATTKRKLGISVESITADKLPPIPAATLDQALIGKIPGAQISSVSGNPGDNVNFVLRGINTVQGGTRPLIIQDGVEIPFENLKTLDYSQVERVEVVQGAASASLYGAQGANGVVQIFTKKGVKGRTNINFSSSITQNSFINAGHFGKADKHPYLTDAQGNIVAAGSNPNLGYAAGDPIQINPDLGVIQGSNSIAYRYGANVPGLTSDIPGLTNNFTRYGILDPRNKADQAYSGNLKFYDHFAQVFTNSQSRNNTLSISGGSEKLDFNLAFSNNHTSSPFLKGNGYLDKTNVTANIGFEVFKNFTLRSVTTLAYTRNTMHPSLGAPGGGGYGTGIYNANVNGVYGFLNTSPFFSLQDTITGGNYASYQRASFLSVNAFNPYYRIQYTSGDSKRYDITQNLEANYKINKFVSLNARYGITFKNENDIWKFYNQSQNANTEDQGSWTSYYAPDEFGEIDNWQYNNTKQNFLATANFKTDFEKDFNIHFPLQTNTLVGFDYRRNDYKELDTWGQGLSFNPPYTLTAVTGGQHIASDYVQPFVTYGYLVDQRFDFNNYGGLTAGFRTDYSSAFGAGSKPFTFPHFNAYLTLPSFGFFSAIRPIIPNFKIRAAYGKAGIQPGAFDRYPVLNLQQTGDDLSYTNQIVTRNPNLNVEVSSEKEIGTDLTFNIGKGNWFKSLSLNFTYWKRHTDGAIFSQNVPPSTGATQLITNAITLSSHGWQVGVNIPVISGRNFTWDLTVNAAHQTSVIDNVAGGDIPLTTAAGSTGLVLAAGRKIGEIYGYKALTSITQLRADGKTPFIDPANQSNYEIVNGRAVNKTTKAIFFSDEAESLGDPNPKLNSSLINTITWKNTISLGFQFDWIHGAHLYNQTAEWMYRDGISSDFTKPVTINGETGAFTAYYASAYYALGNTAKGVGNNVTKDYFYYDASFVRLRNVSLGVDFSRFAKKEWLRKLQLVISGRNLLTFTKYPGMDPEISSGASNSAFDRGIDHSTIPNLKSYQLTLNLGF